MRDALFRITVDYLATQGAVGGVTTHESWLSEASSRIPGTAVVVRLSKPTSDELKALVVAAAALIAIGSADAKTITVAAAIAMMNRIKKARKEYGEVSILDAIAELRRPTAEAVSTFLFGNPCRYPGSECRFISQNGDCSISRDAVTATMADMTRTGILRQKNSVEPIEYGIVT
jgi:hypothetical protein